MFKAKKATLTHKQVVIIYIVYEINLWAYARFLTARGSFSSSNRSGFSKNSIIFGADMILSVHIDNKKNDILILGNDPTDGLDNTTLTAEKEYSIKLLSNRRNFVSVCIIID